MKKNKLLIALLTMLSVGAVSAAACAQKEPAHECGHVCPICSKCTDESCTDEACADKCLGHNDDDGGDDETKVPVTGIIVNTDDETHDGTAASPLEVSVAYGQSVEVTYGVRPTGATNKKFEWKIGTLSDGAFTETADTGVSIEDTGSKLTITASSSATEAAVQGIAADGSGVSVYLAVKVESYTAVSSITSSTLTAVEGQEYDYELITAVGVNWDIGGGRTARGDALANGTEGPTSGGRAPKNLTYYANVYNFGITVAPADATNPDVTVSYSAEGIVSVDAVSGTLTAEAAGETIVTVASYDDPTVCMKVKVTVEESLYRGILKSEYDNAEEAANVGGGWDLDSDHATELQESRYNDWHLVMVHSNSKTGDDNNQKIFYMGNAGRPYGICLENNVGSTSGGSLLQSASLMWAKVTVPENALTFNVKLKNNDKTHGQFRVVFVSEDGTVTTLTGGDDGWIGFATENYETTYKLEIPSSIKGERGALVIEHRVTQYDNNAELQIKVMKFEGQVDVTGVQFAKNSATYKVGERTFTVSAAVTPDNATNDKVTYAMAEGNAAGVTVDENGNVTVDAAAAAGVYEIIASSVADPSKTALFTLTLIEDEVEVNKWSGKSELLDGVNGVSWHFINDGYDSGVGEGADLSIRNGVEYAAIELSDRKINSSSFILTFGARVFHRDGETYPQFEVYVIEDGGEPTLIRGIGQETDYFYVDTDEVQKCSYDLSAYIGKTVTIQIGIRVGSHAVITEAEFTGSAEGVTSWANKGELLDTESDAWTVVGDQDSGVGEGVDIKGEGSYITNTFLIGKDYNSLLTFGARVFVRSGETYPDIELAVYEAGNADDNGTVIRAAGAEADTVHVESDDVLRFSYDLSAYAGKTVEIRIRLANAATHCVITEITMGGAAAE